MSISTVLYFGDKHVDVCSWELAVENAKIVTRRVADLGEFKRELTGGRQWLVVIDVAGHDGDVQRALSALRDNAEWSTLPLLFLAGSEGELASVMPLIETGSADFLVGNVSRLAYQTRLRLLWEIKQCRERNRSLKATVADDSKFRLMADNAPVMIWISGTDKKCYWFNRTWLEYTGRTVEQERGNGWAEGVHREDLQQCLSSYTAAFDQRTPFTIDYRLRRRDGEYRWVLDNGVPLYGDAGAFLGYIGSCIDITDIKNAEIELREAARRKNLFLAMLSHELRNPLAPIRNALKVLEFIRLSPADESVVSQMKDIMSRQVAHMGRLLDDLLDMSRIVSDKIQLESAHLDLGKLVTRAVADHRFAADAKRLSVDVVLPEQPAWIVGDATRLSQMFGNLLDNAIKFSVEEGRIDVVLSVSQHNATLSIKDSGVGLKPGSESRVFERFTQDDDSLARTYGGLGLGLWLARTIVTMHHGSISAYSDGVGKGATFVVSLPRIAAPPDDGEPSSDRSLAQRTKRILIVEDNVDSAMTLQMVLNNWGYKTTIAHTGPEAIELAMQFKPFAVVCDIGLPELDGYQVATVLRRVLGRSLSMIAVSGYGRREDKERALAAGFDDHLVKPANLSRLHEFLATHRASDHQVTDVSPPLA